MQNNIIPDNILQYLYDNSISINNIDNSLIPLQHQWQLYMSTIIKDYEFQQKFINYIDRNYNIKKYNHVNIFLEKRSKI